MSLTFVLQSPLSVDECRQRLRSRTVRTYPRGSFLAGLGLGPELNGTIGKHRVRLSRPQGLNVAAPKLVGTLDASQDGGTTLTVRTRYTFGWDRSGAEDEDDIAYLIDQLRSIGQFVEVRRCPE